MIHMANNSNYVFTFDEVEKIVQEGTYALVESISAENENLPENQLDLLSDRLQKMLKQNGLLYQQITGSYNGDKTKHSFFVVKPENMDLKEFRQIIFDLGKEFKQESVVISSKGDVELVFTTGEKRGKACGGRGFINKSKNNNAPKVKPENYSKIKTIDGQTYYIGEYNMNRNHLVEWKA